jgi:hypothetical protein
MEWQVPTVSRSELGYHLAAWQPGDLTLGDWGVNTASNTVWAVVDHNSDFAAVPEPGTLALLGVAWAIGLINYTRRMRFLTRLRVATKMGLQLCDRLTKWRNGPPPACRAGERVFLATWLRPNRSPTPAGLPGR